MNESYVPNRQSIVYLLLAVAASIAITAAVAGYNNSFRSLPLYLFLLFAGIALMLAFGTLKGGVAGLVIISIWIILKRATGGWEDIPILSNIFELFMVLVVFAICGFYNDRLRIVLDAYYNSVSRLEQLNFEDKRVGLIKPTIGKLRLQEEEERSIRYKRPFSLLLIYVQSIADRDPGLLQDLFLMRIVANTVKSTTRRTDIPFLIASDQIGLILPETDIKGTNRVISNIMHCMETAHFTDDTGRQVEIHELIQIRYGFSAFNGSSSDKIDMLQAAKRSLDRTLAWNKSFEFQNSKVECEVVGSLSVTPTKEPASEPDTQGDQSSLQPAEDQPEQIQSESEAAE